MSRPKARRPLSATMGLVWSAEELGEDGTSLRATLRRLAPSRYELHATDGREHGHRVTVETTTIGEADAWWRGYLIGWAHGIRDTVRRLGGEGA